MTYLADLLGTLVFSVKSLRAQAERRAHIKGVVCFSAGCLAYAMVRNSVYAALPELMFQQTGLVNSFFQLNLIQTLLFLLLVYIPTLIVLSNSIAGDGLGLAISSQEYQSHISALLPLWGLLFLITAPLQWVIPHFLIIGVFEISVSLCVRFILIVVYTIWSIKQLNYLSLGQTFAVSVLSCFTLPVFYILTSFLFALPLFVMIPLAYLAFQWLRDRFGHQMNEQVFQRHLHTLTLNPRDADAHYQLGLIHLKRRNLNAAQRYFESALKIDPGDPDYHYFLGRVHEMMGEWDQALEQYEETYRMNPEYGLGDICREVGKGYLHTGNLDKGKEFLTFFLKKRSSDPEGRYWLAVALQKTGDTEQMRIQLSMIAEQARANPRFFRKGNREWIYRARNLIRNSRFEIRD